MIVVCGRGAVDLFVTEARRRQHGAKGDLQRRLRCRGRRSVSCVGA
jgi:hypothetical protein